MSKDIPAELMVSQEAVTRYIEANREIAKHLGKAPGPLVLMALILEREDPMEFARDYCELLLGSSSTETRILAL